MKNQFKRIAVLIAVVIMGAVGLSACSTDADVVNQNIDTASENFEVFRRVVAVNTQNNEYLLQIEGRCDISPKKGRVLVTCKVSDGKGVNAYKRHQIYTNGNRVAVVVEQLEAVNVSAYHYRMTFKPQSILPDPDFKGSATDNPISNKGDGQ